jgi:hypothetical protein
MEAKEAKNGGMNKIFLALGAALVVLVLIGVVFYVMTTRGSEDAAPKKVVQENLKKIEPEDIGFTLEAAPDGQNVLMDVTKPEGIETLDYEVNYDAEGNLPRGTIGVIDIAGGEELPKKVYLGTCSSGTCKPDKGVSVVNVTVKVTYTNGDKAQLEASVNMAE